MGQSGNHLGRRVATGIAGAALVGLGVVVGTFVGGRLIGTPAPTPAPQGPAPSSSAVLAEWRTFAPPGGAFAVEFPSAPLAGRQDLATGVGTASATTYSAFRGLSLFALSYADVVGLSGIDDVDAAALTSGLLENEEATVTGSTPISEQDYEGLRVSATATGVVLNLQLLVAKERLYVGLVSAPTDRPATAEDIEHFFSSFQVDVSALPSPAPSVEPASPGSSSQPTSSGSPSTAGSPVPSTPAGGAVNPFETSPNPANSSPRPTPPIAAEHLPTGWQTWYSPTWKMVLGYPPGWLGTSRERFDSFASPDGSQVVLVSTHENQPERTLEQISLDDQNAVRAQSGWQLGDTRQDRLGALPAIWVSYNLISATGMHYEAMDIFAISGGTIIGVTWVGPAKPSPEQVSNLRALLATITLTS